MGLFSDWIYHHKKLILAIILLLIGGVGGAFALKQEEWVEENTWMSDASVTKEIDNQETKEIQKEEATNKNEVKEEKLTIDIKGAVVHPNVYEVKAGTRIYELISLAGGLTQNAYTKNINLSKKVEDEMVIYIFTENEYITKTTCKITNDYKGEISKEIEEKNSIISDAKKEDNGKISLNHATLEELLMVDGIGESKAKNIIDYREQNQGFQSIEELKEVNGIGEVLYEKIKENFIL